jgi:hypothetical protein
LLCRFEEMSRGQKSIPQGLKPQFLAGIERPKAKALGYLEARATANAAARTRATAAARARANAAARARATAGE